jgi:Polyketide cyclase / dehydrase and lipid transport
MQRRQVKVTASTPAGRESVFGLLADGASWPQWSPIESFALERAGDPPPEGVGAIRVFRRGRTTGRDQIIELVPNRSVTYATLSGVPVRDYVGEVELDSAPGGGTVIHWHSTFYPAHRGTGWILERGLRRFLAQCANGLATYAARQSNADAGGS